MRTFLAPNPSHLTHASSNGFKRCFMPRAVHIGRNFPHTLPMWPWGEPFRECFFRELPRRWSGKAIAPSFNQPWFYVKITIIEHPPVMCFFSMLPPTPRSQKLRFRATRLHPPYCGPVPGSPGPMEACLTAVHARACYDEQAGCVTFQSQLCMHVRVIMSRQGA